MVQKLKQYINGQNTIRGRFFHHHFQQLILYEFILVRITIFGVIWKCLKMAKMVIFKHVAKGRQGSPMVAKGFQGPRGTQGMGEMSYNQIGHI